MGSRAAKRTKPNPKEGLDDQDTNGNKGGKEAVEEKVDPMEIDGDSTTEDLPPTQPDPAVIIKGTPLTKSEVNKMESQQMGGRLDSCSKVLFFS